MKLKWMRQYRQIIGDFYRSANGYSQICKTEIFGDTVKFSPYEVQIMEHIMEHADDHKNMKWYAEHLGLSQATYSKYVKKLVDKGLIEKYHTTGNKKNIILKVSELGMEEYQEYAKIAEETWFDELFDILDQATPSELELIEKMFSVLGNWHNENSAMPPEAVKLVKIK